MCGLGWRPDDKGAVILRYSLYPEMEGQGYGTEASKLGMEMVAHEVSTRSVVLE